MKKLLVLVPLAAAGSLVFTGAAWAHAIVSPAVVKTKVLQQFTLSVPTEKEGLTTTKVELTVPTGFTIDSFEPPPAPWRMVATTNTVTWSGGHTSTEQDSVFRFNGSISKSGTMTFDVRQTYSDGSVVDWNGPESSDDPAPQVQAVDSFGGGGGSSTLGIVAIVVAASALLIAVLGLAGRKRPLA